MNEKIDYSARIVGGSSSQTVDAASTTQIKLLNLLPENGKPWYRTSHLVKLNLIVASLNLASTTSGYDGSLINSLQSMTSWNAAMGHPTNSILGTISNGVPFGMLLSMLVASTLSDKLGRKTSIYIGNTLLVIGTVIQGISGLWVSESDLSVGKNCGSVFGVFIMARVIVGLGNGIAMVSATPLQSELCYPSHRQPSSSIFNACWYLGALLCAWVSYGTRNMVTSWSWRAPVFIQGFFPLMMFITMYFTPESLRYLVSKGKNAEAKAIFVKYHAGGDENARFIDLEMNEIISAIEQERLANSTSYLDFFKTKGNRKRLFLVFAISFISQMSGSSLVSYYLSKILTSIGISSTTEQLEFNGILMTYNFVTAFITNLYVQQIFRRRTVFLSALSFMLGIFVVWSALSAINYETNFEKKSLGQGVMAMIFLFYFCFNYGIAGPMFLYISEILPFTLRAKGTAISSITTSITTLFNGHVNPIALEAIVWKFYVIYCAVIAVELVIVYFFFVETSGRTLEEVAEIFDDIQLEVLENGELEFVKSNPNSLLPVKLGI